MVRAARPYQPGDSARLVHWPATAHEGRLMVRETETDRDALPALVVDLHGPGEAAEEALGRAAGAAADALARDGRVRLITAEPVTSETRSPIPRSVLMPAATLRAGAPPNGPAHTIDRVETTGEGVRRRLAGAATAPVSRAGLPAGAWTITETDHPSSPSSPSSPPVPPTVRAGGGERAVRRAPLVVEKRPRAPAAPLTWTVAVLTCALATWGLIPEPAQAVGSALVLVAGARPAGCCASTSCSARRGRGWWPSPWPLPSWPAPCSTPRPSGCSSGCSCSPSTRRVIPRLRAVVGAGMVFAALAVVGPGSLRLPVLALWAPLAALTLLLVERDVRHAGRQAAGHGPPGLPPVPADTARTARGALACAVMAVVAVTAALVVLRRRHRRRHRASRARPASTPPPTTGSPAASISPPSPPGATPWSPGCGPTRPVAGRQLRPLRRAHVDPTHGHRRAPRPP